MQINHSWCFTEWGRFRKVKEVLMCRFQALTVCIGWLQLVQLSVVGDVSWLLQLLLLPLMHRLLLQPLLLQLSLASMLPLAAQLLQDRIRQACYISSTDSRVSNKNYKTLEKTIMVQFLGGCVHSSTFQKKRAHSTTTKGVWFNCSMLLPTRQVNSKHCQAHSVVKHSELFSAFSCSIYCRKGRLYARGKQHPNHQRFL